jgi:hypothetical protein
MGKINCDEQENVRKANVVKRSEEKMVAKEVIVSCLMCYAIVNLMSA